MGEGPTIARISVTHRVSMGRARCGHRRRPGDLHRIPAGTPYVRVVERADGEFDWWTLCAPCLHGDDPREAAGC